jgi:hypothetical protein
MHEVVEGGGVPGDVAPAGPGGCREPHVVCPARDEAVETPVEAGQCATRDRGEAQAIGASKERDRVVRSGHEVEHGEEPLSDDRPGRALRRADQAHGGEAELLEAHQDRMSALH